MSERFQFGCACCSPHMLPTYQHDHSQWQDLLDEVAKQEGPRGLPQAVIFHGGHIYPDPEHPEHPVEALGIANGKVIKSGMLDDVRKAMSEHNPVERLLTGDETLLPGLIDPHAHLI